MPTIEIDFEVFKALTVRRETEAVSCNDVIRSMLGLHAVASDAPPSSPAESSWVCKGVRFPVGTDLRASYKGRVHTAKVGKDGIVMMDGARASSPSDAARLVTHNNVNGWTFWEGRFPGETRWQLLKSLRNEL